MKYCVWLLSVVNIYFGFYNLLNVLNILDSSKYSKSATFFFALIFLTMGLGAFYLSIIKHNQKTALLLTIGPWILALLFLFIVMLTSDYK